jgi:acyl-CoA thioesterase I
MHAGSKKVIFSIVIVVVVGALLYFLFRSPSLTVKNTNSEGTTIVAFGDSLISGVGSSKGNDFVSVLSRKINHPIINLGKSGNTTAQGLARIDEVITHDPKIVLVLLGGNDFLRKVPIEETFSNLSQIVTRIQESGAAVILLGVRGGLFTDTYEKHFREFAETHQTAYVSNVLGGLLGKEEFMADTIHPNDKGYEIIAERVRPVIEEILNKDM